MSATSPSFSAKGARRSVALLLAVVLPLFTPAPAFAHGITSDAEERSVLGFVPLGIEHMLLGWDHILFIGGVVLLAGEWKRAAKLISVFVVGHSITLITATLAGWKVNATFVDVVIVLSVVFVGAYGMIGRPRRWDTFGGTVFLFGLVHGLGLATRFQALEVPEDGMLWRVIAFNAGIEIGQLTAIVGVLAVAAVASLAFGRDREPVMRKGAYAALFGVGTVAAPLLAYQGFTTVNTDGSVAAAAPDSSCVVEKRSGALPAGGGGHTQKAFYEPGEEVPIADFGHSLGDGFVVLLYPRDLPSDDVDQLRDYVTTHEAQAVVAGPHTDSTEEVVAITYDQTMICDEVDVAALRKFSTNWVESITGS
jgi:hydrogenase/urease accessory protein HupE